jgi:hypothetical protein
MASHQDSEDSKPQEQSDQRELKQDALVEKLVPDPAAPPDTIVLVGFLGKSARAGYWRLYLTSELNDYVECREDDIVNTQSLATELTPLAGTMMWIKPGAELLHTRTTSIQAQAQFFRGEIMNRFLAGSRMRALFGSRRIIPFAGGGSDAPWCITPDPTVCRPSGAFDPDCCAITEWPQSFPCG